MFEFDKKTTKKYEDKRSEMMRTPRTVGEGPFEANDESLKQYKCPEWFRDAKFGIWAHWGPQGVPGIGDWYARNMYLEGSRAYKHHLENYGHPSEFGYKDIIDLWKAENFDPDKLMDKYVAAGAKYFVALGVHVDNYDCWDSTYTRWNSTELGPKKNIVGMWQEAAKKKGLRFGVTEHLSNYYNWFGTSKLADKTGDKKDVPYDGNFSENWDLYFSQVTGDDLSYFGTPKYTPTYWQHEWFHRMKDLIDQHDPDLFYIDGGIQFDEVGRELMAYYYNHNMSTRDALDGVYNIKNIGSLGEYVEDVATLDLERGVANEITKEPWQIDTCIGDWFYKKGINYKTTAQVIEFLVDTVSKNGNLLLSVPVQLTGELDDYCENFLKEVGQWMDVNGEAIYGTRPWRVYGESIKTKLKATESKNEDDFKMGETELRFTKKDNVVYAFGFNKPADSEMVIKSITSLDQVTDLSILGFDQKIDYVLTKAGLVVTLPKDLNDDLAFVVKITG